jgi:formyl-CoA transferase
MTEARALDGVVVIELGQVYNGPYCGLLLQRLGATVVKVEPFAGEPVRWRSGGTDPAFALLNAGKLGVRLDLKSPEGTAVLDRLLESADVLVENFAPGVVERLGISYEQLADKHPELVYASGRAFAESSVHADRRGMDITVQAMSGVVSVTGFPDGPPVKAGAAVVDFAAGSHLASAVLAALFQRERTGRGQHVQVSMQDAILPSLTSNIAGYVSSAGAMAERTGNRHGGLSVAPYNIYPCADGWLAILCIRDRQWLLLCDVMERPDLASNQELTTALGRVKHMDEVDEIITAWTAGRSAEQTAILLDEAGIPSSRVLSLQEVVEDKDIRSRGMLEPLGPDGALTFGSPLDLSGSARRTDLTPAPLLGEHTREVLTGLAGFSAGEVDALSDAGVV